MSLCYFGVGGLDVNFLFLGCYRRPPRRKSAHISRELYALPGNTICADCGNSKPKWARYDVHSLYAVASRP